MYENSFTFTKMLAAYGKPLRFAGRSTRTELLGYLIISWLVSAILSRLVLLAGVAASIDLDLTSLDFANLLVWLPFPALAVRRFHDQGKPGWWAVPLILPSIVWWLGGEAILSSNVWIALSVIYLLALVLLFWKPTDGKNRFGPDPRLDPEDAVLALE